MEWQVYLYSYGAKEGQVCEFDDVDEMRCFISTVIADIINVTRLTPDTRKG